MSPEALDKLGPNGEVHVSVSVGSPGEMPPQPPAKGDVDLGPFWLYNGLLTGLLPLLAVALAVGQLTGRRAGRAWREQLGLELGRQRLPSGGIWIQACSVGETLAVRRLISDLKQLFPGTPLVLSCTTPEGARIAREKTVADHVIGFPYDLPWIVPRFFELLNPRLCILVETEIWPGFIGQCLERQIPLVLVNGRISPSRMGRYTRLGWLYSACLSAFTRLLMQSREDGLRIQSLGASPRRLDVVGDMKYDQLVLEEPGSSSLDPRRSSTLVAGSTHPGESEVILDLFAALISEVSDRSLVLAPRHGQTVPSVLEHGRRLGLDCRRRSDGADVFPGGVLVLDTMGELDDFYGRGLVAFVGGSLVPVGGHSLLEPAARGAAVIHGPHAFNFSDAVELLKRADGSRQVLDPRDLRDLFRHYLTHPEEARSLGHRARSAVAERRGATDRTLEHLEAVMDARRG